MTPRTQVLLVAAILTLAGAVDFVQRIHMPRSLASRDPGIEATVLPDQPLSLASARQRLESWLPTQATGSQTASIEVVNESRRSGAARTPDRADIGGWHFVLRGVFDAGPPFAVFDVRPSAGGEVEQHRLSVGELIKGVRVERISGRSVSLTDGQNRTELSLFINARDYMIPANEYIE